MFSSILRHAVFGALFGLSVALPVFLFLLIAPPGSSEGEFWARVLVASYGMTFVSVCAVLGAIIGFFKKIMQRKPGS